MKQKSEKKSCHQFKLTLANFMNKIQKSDQRVTKVSSDCDFHSLNGFVTTAITPTIKHF
jgi:flagella basal body P-ring formation protein FlgA